MSLLRSSLNAFLLTRAFRPLQATACRPVQRWVAPTLRELRKRAKKLGPQPPQRRSGFVEWNYRAELFAFGKRLQEQFQLPLLQTAFTQRSYVLQEQQRQRELGIEEADLKITDNAELAARGAHLSRTYVQAFLQHSLPRVPATGRVSIAEHLLTADSLAHIAERLGMRDLVFADEYPPPRDALAESLLAVVGALAESSGEERAFRFVRDFICTQLSQCDLLELWHIENPEELLVTACREQKLPDPEPRLIGDCGKNTVLAAYQVGVYADKQLLGKGFGEDVPTAIRTASLNALQKLYGIQDHMRPFDFQLQVEPKCEKLTQN